MVLLTSVVFFVWLVQHGVTKSHDDLIGRIYPLDLTNLSDPYAIDFTKLDLINFRFSTKIIGGNEAGEGQFPHQAAIYIMHKSGTSLFCGGSLISKNVVLTAAHCILSEPRRIIVVLGNKHLYTYNRYEVRVDVAKFVVHRKFNPSTLKNDICLLHLQKPVRFNGNIRPIRLPSYKDANKNYLNNAGIISGFGKTSDEGEVSTRLMFLRVKVMDNFLCNMAFNDRDTEKTNICTRGYEKIGACQGDSGGPLLINQKLIGIVSYGSQICTIGYPTVYTRVPTYLSWIGYNANIKIEE